jgi:hypothetical protein
VLFIEALAITLLPPESLQKAWVKIPAIVVCFLLAVGDISVIRHDRQESTINTNRIFMRLLGCSAVFIKTCLHCRAMYPRLYRHDLCPLTI